MRRTVLGGAAVLAMSVVACSTTGGAPPHAHGDGGGADAGADAEAGLPGDGGLAKSTPPDQGSLDAGQLLLTASGEWQAVAGYPFPDAGSWSFPVFADGWALTFTHFIATFDKVVLWENPDIDPNDPSRHGPPVAEVDGPWAIDLHQDAPGWPYVLGKEDRARAIAFAVLRSENLNGDSPFPTDGTRLAVGFSVVVATPNALDVNLDADGRDAYQRMIASGCVTLYTGTATWSGDQGLCNGRAPPADAGSDGSPTGGTGGEAEFTGIPKVVAFDLCFKPRAGGLRPGDVETSFVNCFNPDTATLPVRGVAFPANRHVEGQLTLRPGYPFRQNFSYLGPMRFDPLAAQVVGVATDGGLPVVHFEDVAGVDFAAFTDKAGNALPWRTCDPSVGVPPAALSGQMRFPALGVPRCTDGGPPGGLCDYQDFAKYAQSQQGCYNGPNGVCFVQHAYPSPP